MQIIVTRRDGILGPIYYQYYDSFCMRAVFGKKKTAVRLLPGTAELACKQLRSLSYDVVVMEEETRFSKTQLGG